MKDWHALELGEVEVALGSDLEKGLGAREAKKRLQEGENILAQQRGPGPITIFLSQFSDFMVLVLMGAAVLSGWLGEWSDAITILTIVFLNATLGFIQEYRAEKSLEALRRLSAPVANVKRGGQSLKIPASEVVPGDLVELAPGDRVPADLRLIQITELEVDESTLTGESMPVVKHPGTIAVEEPLAEQRNMAWMGTLITRGQAQGVVVSTGMETQMGQIASLLSSSHGATPLEKRLAQLGKFLVLACGGLCALVVLLGILRGEPLEQMVMIGISLAVAAIPEGLPAIVTIALALGVQRMSQRRAIIRQLPAVETLGCVSVICADKTGTLTANALSARILDLNGKKITITGEGYNPLGDFYHGEKKISREDPALKLALNIAVLCNKAKLSKRERGFSLQKKWEGSGDPTEIALLVLGGKGGIWSSDLLKGGVQITQERPFDSTRKMMSVLCRIEGEFVTYTKGAPEVILARCNRIYQHGKLMPLDSKAEMRIKASSDQMADEAMRVLALAYRPWSGRPGAAWEQDLVFVGLVGMADHPREGVRSSIAAAKRAGIQTVMITGDHARTAVAVAKNLGLEVGPGQVWEESELAQMSQEKFRKIVRGIRVFARVTPKRKLAIVKALRESGSIVAMTGDGVNDAPALREADVGVAMGRSGTDVAREAAHVVLTDDNFTTIVAAIEEGRGIYENIRKFIRYLLGCNVGEILLMLVASVLGLPAPLLPIQLLWVNLITDGLPAMALGLEPPERELMEEAPRKPDEGIFARGLLGKIGLQGLIVGGGSLVAFMISFQSSGWDLQRARTVAFCTLVFSQLAFAFRCRSEHHDAKLSWQGNPILVLSIMTSFMMQYLVLWLGPMARIFHTVPLEPIDWTVVFFFSHWPFLLYNWAKGVASLWRRRWAMVKI